MENIQFIGLTPTQLVDLIDDRNQHRLEELKRSYCLKEPEEYLTRDEVKKMLKVDLSTIHNWTKKGYLIHYGIGGRVYYKRSELENALIRLK
ncbi:helix-turn-helix domain-containing protein [Lutimonas zeaxanthinifaciens]|uniref:helix-turn-helix domain-containing protein n=1 Tax=Lutimonas zeaxanthinifaciens TaxID=3060215 RepID=UPI00265CC348|nr:helix-turn-helix domain-containing protein [Lutimonas sp. YSD2104]WKK66510.1 helix-turn-helix domain-containing protein [Lutimonas sp. YSD2104]